MVAQIWGEEDIFLFFKIREQVFCALFFYPPTTAMSVPLSSHLKN